MGVPVTLDARTSQGDTLGYGWDFGDGTTAGSGVTVQHTYAAVDDYHVQLTIRDRQGNSNTASQTLRVIPSLGAVTGQPVLGQIVPAALFPAELYVVAPGPAQITAQIGGQYLSSASWDYDGNSGPILLQIPNVRVANEDNADIASQLIDQPGGSIPLTGNVGVTLSYRVSSGNTESATYTTSLTKPIGSAASPVPVNNAPAPTLGTSPAGSSSRGAAGLAIPHAGNVDTLAYAQVSPTPAPARTPAATAGTRVAATPTASPTATPRPAPAPATTQPAPAGPTPWAITYPNYLPLVGLPANDDEVGGYYLKGDSNFHHADSPLVRRYAIKIARNGGVFPDDPGVAADNIWRYVRGLLGIGDPGQLQTDTTILSRVEDGSLVPGAREDAFICIAQAYFLASLTRTLGLPTREVTVGLGSGVDRDDSGAWIVNYYQEGADQVWYDGDWHHYDTWIGTRSRDDYLSNHLNEVTWYSFSVENTSFLDVNDNPTGLSGHDFSIGKFAGSPGSPDQWRFLEQHVRPGLRIAPPGPDAYVSVDAAAPASSTP